MTRQHCLVTGATGYIGGRLVPHLLAAGHDVRVLARTPAKLDGVAWADQVEVVQGDLGDVDSLTSAATGIDVFYNLVHSMGGSEDFASEEAANAHNIVEATTAAEVDRIVYLSGLHPRDDDNWSTHLASRIEVGRILMAGPVPTVVLQAGVVIGSGSASFELIRHLTERLPVMTTPRWVHNRIQPIAIVDALHYLVEAATAPIPTDRAWDIGSPDVMTYGDMMSTYARVAGLGRRHRVVLRPLTPTLASRWVGLVTPIPPGLARPLIESLECDAIMVDHDIDEVIPRPSGGLLSYEQAVLDAIDHDHQGIVDLAWSDVDPLEAPAAPMPNDPDWSGELLFTDDTQVRVDAPAERVLAAARDLVGGAVGLDRLPSVPASSIGTLVTGTEPDTESDTESGDEPAPRQWEQASAGTHGDVLLSARAPIPARLWLEVRTRPSDAGTTTVGIRLVCAPRGLGGISWWHAVWPLRSQAQRDLATAISERAIREGAGE